MLTLLVAAAENNVIGRHGELPWRLPADLKRFKALTLGHPVVMGRKTFESIGRPLPGRPNIVVTRQVGWAAPLGVTVCSNLPDALHAARALSDEVFIIGGGELYAQTLPLADRVQLTRVHTDVPGDAFFPALAPAQWREVWREDHPADERHAHRFSFVELRRVG